MSNDDFIFRARKQFPDSAVELLKVINKVPRQSRLPPRFLLSLQTCVDEHLFCLIECKGVFSTKLSPIQEIQLNSMLCTFFEERKSTSTRSDGGPSLLELIFFSSEMNPALAEARCGILAKTISLAAQLHSTPLLNDAAAWMQKVCFSPPKKFESTASAADRQSGIPLGVKKVCSQLVEDYCNFGPSSMEDTNTSSGMMHQHRRMQQQRVVLDLATLSPGFIPYIAASAMTNYDWFITPPSSLFEILTDWISLHPALLLKPYKEAAKFSSLTSMAFVRLLSQAFGKLLCLCLVNSADESNSASASHGRLQLALLRLMEMFPKIVTKSESEEIQCAIVTTRMVTDTLKVVQQQQIQPKNMQKACYALFRALQMAVGCGCFVGTKRELEQALAPYLSDYPFMEFVLNECFS